MTEFNTISGMLQLPTTQSDAPSVYAFSVYKSGSTLLFNMLAELASDAGYAYFSLPDQMFVNGISPHTQIPEATKLYKNKGYIFGGFRSYPDSGSYHLPDISGFTKIFLIRNPLDALVSKYYSDTQSHMIPKQGTLRKLMLRRRKFAQQLTLDEYVRNNCDAHIHSIKSYTSMLNQENLYIFRYEDIIYEKKEFLISICNIFGWKVGSRKIERVASKYDIFPAKESADQHVRQVDPGNHKKHLTDETRDFLEWKFSDILEAFGYKVSSSMAYSRLIQGQ